MRNWKKYEKIIRGWAYKFSLTLKEPVEDLIQEGFICFLEVTKIEDEEGLDCEFEAALSRFIKERFINFYKQRFTQKNFGTLVSFDKLSNTLSYSSKAMEIYAGLLPRHKGFVDLFMNVPQELITLLRAEGFEKGLKIYMETKLEWKEGRIRLFFLDYDRFIVE